MGYNYIIERDGSAVKGRSLDLPGAHCKAGGMNFKSIGIALIGNFEAHPPTGNQVNSLMGLVRSLQEKQSSRGDRILPQGGVIGASTLCPGRYFPMETLLRGLKGPPPVWRVQAGAFESQENAENYKVMLEKMGIDCYVVKPWNK